MSIIESAPRSIDESGYNLNMERNAVSIFLEKTIGRI